MLSRVTASHDDFDELLVALRRRGGLDFGAYQPAHLERRIRARMAEVGVAGFRAYRAHLALHPEEHARLCEAVPVLCTGFFRDPEVWALLGAEVLPAIARAKAEGEPVRAWSAGCATGEEAYSLAVALAEALGEGALARGRVRVFATDVSERALATAREGRYEAWRMAAVPDELRARYFRPEGRRWWSPRPELAASVTFARHDLLTPSPFAGVDLVACRHALLYFTAEARLRVLARLHRALRDGGVLLLGRWESPRLPSELFEAEAWSLRVFRRAPLPGRAS